jgi:hypothetical protein
MMKTLAEAWTHFAVGEFDEVGISELDAEMSSHFVREGQVGAPRVEGHPLGRHLVHEVTVSQSHPVCHSVES